MGDTKRLGNFEISSRMYKLGPGPGKPTPIKSYCDAAHIGVSLFIGGGTFEDRRRKLCQNCKYAVLQEVSPFGCTINIEYEEASIGTQA